MLNILWGQATSIKSSYSGILDTFSCYKVVDEESVELSNITGNRKAIFLIYNIQTLEVLVRYSQAADLEKMNLIVASPRIQETALYSWNQGLRSCRKPS